MTVNAERVNAVYNFKNVLNTEQKYVIPFPFLSPDHIHVYLYQPDGRFIQLRTPLHYRIQYNHDTRMGNLYTNADMTLSDKTYNTLVIRRHTPRTQELLFLPYAAMYAKSKERALDKLTMLILEVEHEVRKSPKLPVTHALVDKGIEFPHVDALGVVRYNKDGTALETVPTSELVNIVEDTSPVLGGDLDANKKTIKNVARLIAENLKVDRIVECGTIKPNTIELGSEEAILPTSIGSDGQLLHVRISNASPAPVLEWTSPKNTFTDFTVTNKLTTKDLEVTGTVKNDLRAESVYASNALESTEMQVNNLATISILDVKDIATIKDLQVASDVTANLVATDDLKAKHLLLGDTDSVAMPTSKGTNGQVLRQENDRLEWWTPAGDSTTTIHTTTTIAPPVRDYAKFYTKNYKEVRLKLDNVYTEAVIDVDDQGHLTVVTNSESESVTLDHLTNDNTVKIHEKIKAVLDLNKIEYEYADATSAAFTNEAIEGQRYLILRIYEELKQGDIVPSVSKVVHAVEYHFTSVDAVEYWEWAVSGQTLTITNSKPTASGYADFKNRIKTYASSDPKIEEKVFIIQSDTDRRIITENMQFHEITLFDIVSRRTAFAEQDYLEVPRFTTNLLPNMQSVRSFAYYKRDFGGGIGIKEGFIFTAFYRGQQHPVEFFFVELAVNPPTPYKVFQSGWLPSSAGARGTYLYNFAIDTHDGKDYLVRHFGNFISHYEITWDGANNKLTIKTAESKRVTISGLHGKVTSPFIIGAGLTQDRRWTLMIDNGSRPVNTFEVDEKDGSVYDYETLLWSVSHFQRTSIVNFASGYQLMARGGKLYKVTTTHFGTVEVKGKIKPDKVGDRLTRTPLVYIAKHPSEGYLWATAEAYNRTGLIYLLKSTDGWRTANMVKLKEHYVQLPASDFFKLQGFSD